MKKEDVSKVMSHLASKGWKKRSKEEIRARMSAMGKKSAEAKKQAKIKNTADISFSDSKPLESTKFEA